MSAKKAYFQCGDDPEDADAGDGGADRLGGARLVLNDAGDGHGDPPDDEYDGSDDDPARRILLPTVLRR